ncbi:4Fe-4S binding protein [Thiolapillus sp.]
MDRRAFFRRSIEKVTRGVTKEASRRARKRASNWLRPPFAIDELEFLLACTRCKACIDACPHDVIFPLPANRGVTVVATPALDLLNRGCHLCDDWPCVAACEPKALFRAEPEEEDKMAMNLPKLALVHIDASACLPYKGPECGACASSCPVPGALLWDGQRPRIDADKCPGCALCREACIAEPKVIDVLVWEEASS